MTREEQKAFDRENMEAMSMANRRTVPSECTGYSIPASAEDRQAMNMAKGLSVPVFERDTYYHIEASAEDAEAMNMVHDAPKPLSPGAIHRTYTVNEYGQVETAIPDDYRESKAISIAKSIGLLALASCASAGIVQAISRRVSNIIIYVILAGCVAVVGSLARK